MSMFGNPLSAQVVQRDAQGDLILRYEDDSWRYADLNDSLTRSLVQLQDVDYQRVVSTVSQLKTTMSKSVLAVERANTIFEQLLEKSQSSPDNEQLLQQRLQEAEKALHAHRREQQRQQQQLIWATQALDSYERKDYWKPWLQLQNSGYPAPTLRYIPKQSQEPVEIMPYDAKRNTNQYPPQNRPCQLYSGEPDERTGIAPLHTEERILFRYTSEKLRSVMKKEDFITGYARMTQVSKARYVLSLRIRIASTYAQKEFGMLERGSEMYIYGIQGERIALTITTTQTGHLNPAEKTVVYHPVFMLSKSQYKQLCEIEVDALRLVWSTGYDEYELFDVDFFKDLCHCFEP